MSAPVISVEGIGKAYRIGVANPTHTSFGEKLIDLVKTPLKRMRMKSEEWDDSDDTYWAIRNINFQVNQGEVCGIIGRNGAGKSTLLKVLSRITEPTEGLARVRGRVASLLEVGTGFHPELSGRENIYLNGAILGMRRQELARKFDEIVAFAELENAIDRPVRTYSSGMYMRLGFAIAAHLDADVLLLDEVFAVGDEAFQRKCFGKIFEFKQRGGTIVFVSHDATQVERLCERAVLLRDGGVELSGPTHDAIVRYRRVLAAESDPAERAAGLREWGTGEATIVSAELVGAGGEERRQFLSGEPFSLRLRIDADEDMAPPFLQLELRDDGGLLVASDTVDTAVLGWANGGGERLLRYDIERLPLSDGRFHIRLGLSDASGARLLHWLDDALGFLVYPSGDERGVVRLEGSWVLEQKSPKQ